MFFSVTVNLKHKGVKIKTESEILKIKLTFFPTFSHLQHFYLHKDPLVDLDLCLKNTITA